MMTIAFRFLSFGAGALLLAGCGSITGDYACTADYRYGLTITVVDSVTSEAPASAVLIAASDVFVDSVGPATPQLAWNGVPYLVLSAAGERAGTYDLTVRAPGYRVWTRDDVRVTADRCHVRGIALTARLQR